MKITILWGALASYSVAFFKELSAYRNCQLQLIYFGTLPDAPYDGFDLSFCSSSINRTKKPKLNIEKAVNMYSPDCVLMCSWNYCDYMKITRRLRKEGVFVVSTIDNQWRGTLKQWLGILSSRWFLKPSIDCFLAAGDRQANFARRLGYDRILYGLYAASVEEFKNTIPLYDRDPCFLFVGRLAPEKGIGNLMEAYRLYREKCSKPWYLKVAGTGELKYLLQGIDGVKPCGFVQPKQMPELMKSATNR